jgi:transaldolase
MHLEESAGADIIYTCKPRFLAALMRREAELDRFRPDAIDDDVPVDVRDKLMRLPSFRRAIDPAGMRPDEFQHYGPLVINYLEALHQTRRLIDFVARQLTTAPSPG